MRTAPAMIAACCLLACPITSAMSAEDAAMVETVSFDDGGRTRTISGRVLVTATDGGLLVQERDGRLWTVTIETLKTRDPSRIPFQPYTTRELGSHLATELKQSVGPDLLITTTRHYTIVSSADPRYARWCGLLFERLRTAFVTYWKGRGLALAEPEFPMVAIVLKNRDEFNRFAKRDAGLDSTQAVGYYSMLTNRIVLYDLAAVPGRPPAGTAAEIQRRLATAPRAIATVVHEAAHQVAFNSGLHRRLADNPLWLAEGMAVFFETPDLRSRTGWRTVGQVNRPRLARFVEFVRQRRRPGSLKSLVTVDRRFRDAPSEIDAYAEAWALSYYLMRARRKQYLAYLKTIAAKPLLRWDTPEVRQADFEAAFGNDWQKLDRQFLKYMSRVKPR
ncbi:MAG: hypothetical protein CMJ65_01075 [Planctomycetaceae bacterium]|nr:hypothetical protein [Planctomycetaceae bacterium]MDP7275558.1 DUF1570 domain-containing protein [Planctomycetaceae bacterium]